MLNREMSSPAIKKANGDEGRTRVETNDLVGLIGYEMRMAYLAISRHFSTAMEKIDLTQKQTGVLWLIGANSGISQIALATELGMDRASMMAIIDRLQERDFVFRERSRQDGRRQELYLTPKGRKALAQSKTALASHEEWIRSRFSEAELAALVDALKRLQR